MVAVSSSRGEAVRNEVGETGRGLMVQGPVCRGKKGVCALGRLQRAGEGF